VAAFDVMQHVGKWNLRGCGRRPALNRDICSEPDERHGTAEGNRQRATRPVASKHVAAPFAKTVRRDVSCKRVFRRGRKRTSIVRYETRTMRAHPCQS